MKQKEFFIVSNSFAAPFVSDTGTGFVKANNPEEALETFAAKYSHPCGLYCAVVFNSANDYHKGKKALAQWLCNAEIKKQEVTKNMTAYSVMSESPGRFKINDTWYNVKNPKGGRIVA